MKQKTTFQAIRNKPPGFTLVEVLITLVVIAIAAGLSAPALLSMAPNMTIRSAARGLYSDIQQAKIIAVKENRDVGVLVGTAGYTIGEPFTDTNGDGLYTAAEPYTDSDGDGAYTADKVIVFADEYEYGITLGTGKATKDWNNAAFGTLSGAITFNSRGLSNADSVFLQNRNNDVCFAITVTVAGSVKTMKYGGADPFNVTNWTD